MAGQPTRAAPPVKGLAAGLSSQPMKVDRHPAWYPPLEKDHKGLCVLNSLTETLEEFVPREGRLVKWYTCGPTVYDLSHMGHARAYLTFDIHRRIMEDYFGYAVIYQMNITDIDDKIIKRARINKLLDDFKAQMLKDGGIGKLSVFTAEALAAAEAGLAAQEKKLSQGPSAGAGSRAKTEHAEKLLELQHKHHQLTETRATIAAATATNDFEVLFSAARAVNGELLDAREGHRVTDQRIFEEHARHFERTFFEDMACLGIREPDVVTRVTEYVPRIVAFVQRILDNGFAYRGETSVFFDTEAYVRAGHDYPKLKPGGDRNTTEDEMDEGEGVLSKGVEGEKRSPNDFALWKFSKPGEPCWPSPWGQGRPGWHIECSVMASDVLGANMDIHSGGWDLKFPHHDNECAQSEACHQCPQWVNYFLHCGHLHIKGLKMSKSLKNFISIRQALGELGVTPRVMRLLFLANAWSRPMNFSDQSLDEAREKERVLRAFFGSVDIVRRSDHWQAVQGASDEDRALLQEWIRIEKGVHEALCNNFDTSTALSLLMTLVAATNQYLLSPQRPSASLVCKVARYITRIFQIFGVVDGTDTVGLTPQGGAAGDGSDERLVHVMDALVEFRDGVRDAAKREHVVPAFLPLCDHLRDVALVDAGIRLEDNPAGPTVWKNDDPALMRQELAARRELEELGRRRRLANQIETRRKQLEKWSQYTGDPRGYFERQDNQRGDEGKKFAAFDAITGLPTNLRGGDAVTEKELRKYSKELDKYAKQHAEFVGKGGVQWLEEQRTELIFLQEELEGLK